MRTCPDCNMQLEDRALFCDNCGLKLSPVVAVPAAAPASIPAVRSAAVVVDAPEVSKAAAPGTCSVCGSSNVPGEMFCQNCGVQLAPVVSTPPPPPSPAAEFVKPPVSVGQADLSQAAPVAAPVVVTQQGVPQGPRAASSKVIKPPAPAEETLTRNCPNCGVANNSDELYCQNCGLQLEAAPPEKESQTPDQQPVVKPAAPGLPPAPAAAVQPSTAQQAPVNGQTAENDSEDRFGTAPLNGKAELGFAIYITGKLIVRATKAEIKIPSAKTELTIGRSDPVRGVFPDIDLTTHGGDTGGVSRLHARLSMQGEQLNIEDLNSTNYTYLNRQRLQPEQQYPIKPGDEIRLGLVILDYL